MKKRKNSVVSSKEFLQFLVDQQPVYDRYILKSWTDEQFTTDRTLRRCPECSGGRLILRDLWNGIWGCPYCEAHFVATTREEMSELKRLTGKFGIRKAKNSKKLIPWFPKKVPGNIWLAHVETGKFPQINQASHVMDRFHKVFPDLKPKWVRTPSGSHDWAKIPLP